MHVPRLNHSIYGPEGVASTPASRRSPHAGPPASAPA